MKLLMATLLIAASGAAGAKTVAVSPNRAGGEIVLTDLMSAGCKPGQLWAFTRAADGASQGGCWYFVTPYVFVRWAQTGLVSYPAKSFRTPLK